MKLKIIHDEDTYFREELGEPDEIIFERETGFLKAYEKGVLKKTICMCNH